jgi:predicted nucleotidyltransferase
VQEPYKSLLEKLTKLLQEEFQDKLISVVLYGSVARGDNRKDSDIDLLLVIKDLPKTITERVILFDKVERKLDDYIMRLMDDGYYITFSPVLKTPEEAMRFSPIYMDMTEDAIILYDKNGFFRKVLEKTKKRLEELGFERVWLSKKVWYWRKRDYKFGEIIDFGDVLE